MPLSGTTAGTHRAAFIALHSRHFLTVSAAPTWFAMGRQPDIAMPVRLIILSDIRLYREGVALNVSHREVGVEVGTCADATEALRLMEGSRNAVLLVDAKTVDRLDEVRRIRRHSSEARILALGMPPASDDAMLVAAEAGISGYVAPEAGVDELISTVVQAARGEVRSPSIPAEARARAVSGAGRPSPVSTLTAREQEVLALLNIGLSNKQIARQLSIRLATVKNHVHSILAKLNVKRRGEAVAATSGLIRPL